MEWNGERIDSILQNFSALIDGTHQLISGDMPPLIYEWTMVLGILVDEVGREPGWSYCMRLPHTTLARRVGYLNMLCRYITYIVAADSLLRALRKRY